MPPTRYGFINLYTACWLHKKKIVSKKIPKKKLERPPHAEEIHCPVHELLAKKNKK